MQLSVNCTIILRTYGTNNRWCEIKKIGKNGHEIKNTKQDFIVAHF